MFDFAGNGKPEKVAWTDPLFGNAWLALDRNDNGVIDSSAELFGNFTPQPPSEVKNGFLALAVFDKPENGGNGDGFIDSKDAVYYKLRLWTDVNHNGISEPSELHTLPELGVMRLELSYQNKEMVDVWGNLFRYRAHIWDKHGVLPNQWTYDVYLQSVQ